ncbi:unnamed protein product [Diamesa tonsa]
MYKDKSQLTVKKQSLAIILTNLIFRLVGLIARFFFKNVIYGKKGPAVSFSSNLLLLEPASKIALKIRTRKVTSVQVLKTFIERINEVNPLLNCVVDERFTDALLDAEKADKLIESGLMTEAELAAQKPFLGVPISTKDCIRVKDMLNTSGLYHRRDVRGETDSDVMSRMRKAGAIPFALTNVSECCMWWASENPVHGRTNNPYDTYRIVGGSSGGEGCLNAAAGTPFGLGSDIGGSIRMPAFFCGVFGHKPSKFVVSNEGQYPAPFTMEQSAMLGIGPICRFATDLLPMMKVLCDEDKLPLLKLNEPVDVKSLRIFYQENDGNGNLVSPVDSEISKALQKVVEHFKNVVKLEVTRVQIPLIARTTEIWLANLKTENSPGFDSQLKNLNGKINTWLELGKWLFGRSNHTLIALLTALTENYGVKYGSDSHKKLMEKKVKLIEEFDEMLAGNSVFIYPTHPTVAPYHNEPLFRAFNFSYTSLINIMGLPATHCPLGLNSEGIPLGVQVVAGMNNDRLCLAVACHLERVFGGWRSFE